MASLKKFFSEEPDLVSEPSMQTADDYALPEELESIYAVPRSRGVSPEQAQRSVDMTRRLAGTVVPPPEGELPSDWAKIRTADKSINQPIPVQRAVVVDGVSAPAAPSATTIAATTKDRPAPKAGTPSDTLKPPAPPMPGAGGDDDVRNLYLARLAAQSAAGFGGMGAGKNIDMGIAETLGERMKQIEALRAKRAQTAEERALEQQQYEGANLGTLTSNIASFKDRPEVVAALENLRSGAKYTKPSDFLKAVYQAVMNPPTLAGKEVGVEKGVAQTGVARAQAAAVPAKLEQGEKKIEETAAENLRRDAREWARIRAAADAAANKASAGKSESVQKEVRTTTQKLGDTVAKEYGEISSALKEADRSLQAVKDQPPALFAKVMQATNLDSLNTPEERALFRSVGELRRAAQKAQSGLAVTENERAEFLQLFGQNWLQDPASLLEAIEWMRRKTRDKLNTSFATYRAQGDVGNTAVRAYGEAGGVTPDSEFLLPFNERKAKTTALSATPAPAAAGNVERVIMLNPQGERRAVRADQVEKAKGQGWRMP